MRLKPDQPDPRQAMARLLAEAIKSGPATSDVCPDAELVAAYADQGLSDSERAQLENHFATCQRCQQALAALDAALEAPIGESVAVMPWPAEALVAPRPARSPKPWLWWLSPAFGAAAAALLWMALRPAVPQPVQTAANYPLTAEQERKAMNAPEGNASAVPVAPDAAARRDEQLLERLSKVESGAKENAVETREQAFRQLAAPSADAVSASATLPAARSEVATAAPPQAAALEALAVPTQPARDLAAAANEQAPLQNRATTLGGALSAQAAGGLQSGGRAAAQGGLVTYTFASPTGIAQWRLGAAGLIEKSTDSGQTWQQQASGVTADLLAGSSVSDEVAWVVGRAAVILRTINGQQWQRVAPPAGMTGDWVTVVVRSNVNATIVGPVRRFSTEDGGATWIEQP